MTAFESVASEQKKWSLTDKKLKLNLERSRYTILALSVTGAVLMALAAQFHASYPAISRLAGYAAMMALVLVVVVRSKGLNRGLVQAWVLAAAAAQSLTSEMFRYRTSTGPYNDQLGGDPDATLLERRDKILGRIKSVQRYAVDPSPQTALPSGPLDADGYISERVNIGVNAYQKWAGHFVSAQGTWQKIESFLAIAGALLAAVLTFTNYQIYGAWIAVCITMGLAVGADALAERYAQLTIEYGAMPDRLTGILNRWTLQRGTLDELVERVEAALLGEMQTWVASADELQNDSAVAPVRPPASQPALHSTAARTAHLN
jgi:hypothetical protein